MEVSYMIIASVATEYIEQKQEKRNNVLFQIKS